MTISGSGVETGSTPQRPTMLAWGSTWQALLTAAVALLALGIVLLVWPHGTLAVVAVLIGIALLVTGILRLVQGFTASEESGARRVAYVMIGLLAGLAGLYCLRHIDVTVTVLGVIVGLFWTMHGVVDLALAAGPGRRADRVLTGLMGLFSLAAGLIVIFWPSETLTVLVVVMGIWFICDGLLFGLMAWQLHRLSSAADPLPPAAAIPPQQAGSADPLSQAGTASSSPGPAS